MKAVPITPEAFAPFGEVIAVGGASITINAGLCQRYSDLCNFDIQGGRLGLSLFDAEVRALPYRCDLLERHPLGSQTFVPMGGSHYLVIVAPDAGGKPGALHIFTANARQIVNIARNTWHGVLAPISGSGLFAVLDRIGPPDEDKGRNLEEYELAHPAIITLADQA